MEQRLNSILNRYPAIKRVIKRIYQLVFYLISPKVKSYGNIKRISPDDGMEYFFGYYDKSPWDISDSYMLCLRVKHTYKSVAPQEPAEIILFDTLDNNSYTILAKTNAWNVQQGCMLQWLGPNFDEEIIYNDFRSGKYCSVILNIKTKKEKIIPMPVYTVSANGKYALSLDFSRLHTLRPGYGYTNQADSTENEKCPDTPCIWHVDLTTGTVKPLLKYTDLAKFEPRKDMKNAYHKVNHLMLNPAGNRFMVLHRWQNRSYRYTRLITANIDGSEMYNLNDNMTSHCFWKNNSEILGYARKNSDGDGYYLMQDKSPIYVKKWSELKSDGHPSYSPNGNMVITDTYPNRARIASIYYMKSERIKRIAKVYAPFKYDNELRCDLHPRWSRKGNLVCFDSVFEGKRSLYTVDLTHID